MIGFFIPTYYLSREYKTLFVFVETSQLASMKYGQVPSDNSEVALYGRNLLREINNAYVSAMEELGDCQIRIQIRKYDGEIV